jgi:hypothetical protein
MRARMDTDNLIEGETVDQTPADHSTPEEPIVIAGEIEEATQPAKSDESRSDLGS